MKKRKLLGQITVIVDCLSVIVAFALVVRIRRWIGELPAFIVGSVVIYIWITGVECISALIEKMIPKEKKRDRPYMTTSLTIRDVETILKFDNRESVVRTNPEILEVFDYYQNFLEEEPSLQEIYERYRGISDSDKIKYYPAYDLYYRINKPGN